MHAISACGAILFCRMRILYLCKERIFWLQMKKYESSKMKKYEILKQIGEGSFGQVYKAKKRSDGEIVAFKMIRKVCESKESHL